MSIDGVFNDGVYDIMPVNLASKKRKRRDTASYDSVSNHHAIFKRKASVASMEDPVVLSLSMFFILDIFFIFIISII